MGTVVPDPWLLVLVLVLVVVLVVVVLWRARGERDADLGDAEVLEELGVEGGAEAADTALVHPKLALGHVRRRAEQEEPARHDHVDGAVERAARAARGRASKHGARRTGVESVEIT